MATPSACVHVTKKSLKQALMIVHGEVSSSGALTWGPRRIQASFSGMTFSGKNVEEQRARSVVTLLQLIWKEPRGLT